MSKFIVTTFANRIIEATTVLHEDRELASRYGVQKYGFGKFKIQDFNKFKKTSSYRFHLLKMQSLARIRRFK